MTSNNSSEIRALTSVRMVAALLVILHHFAGYGYPAHAANLFESIIIEGHIGVTIFFVLSGFLITSRYYQDLITRNIRLSEYFTKRVARIYPTYYAVLLLVYTTNGLPALPALLSQITFTQGYFRYFMMTGIRPAWSLSVEEAFYLIAPLVFVSLAALSKSRPFASRPSWVPIGVGLLAWTVSLFVLGQTLNRVALLAGSTNFLYSPVRVTVYSIFGRFFDFAVGIALGLTYGSGYFTRLWQRRGGSVVAGITSAISLLAIVVCQYLMNQAGGARAGGIAWNYVIAVLSGLWIVSLTCETMLLSRVLSLELFVYLGRISYALYLVQFVGAEKIIGGLLRTRHWLYLPALYILLNVISAIIYELIEKPGRIAVMAIGERLFKFKQGQIKQPEQAPS